MFTATAEESGPLFSIQSENKSLFEAMRFISNGWSNCQRCKICEYRTNVVFGKGLLDSGIVIVGDAPSNEDDMIGVPYSAAQGDILDDALRLAGLTHSGNKANCFVTTAIGCRPCVRLHGKNRTAETQEVAACRPRLSAILAAARPDHIVLMGNTATFAVLDIIAKKSVYKVGAASVSIHRTLHPMAAVHNPSRMREWTDFWKRFRTVSKTRHNAGKRTQFQLPLA